MLNRKDERRMKKEVTKKETIVYCGIDFHKNTSTLYAVYQDGQEVEPLTTIRTERLVQFLSNRKNWKLGIEATGGVNHVVEQLKESGHEVVIINSNQFRGIGIGGKKTDERDAKALTNALRLGFVPEVHHRSRRSRELKSLLTSREHLVQARVDAINHVRGTLREYGLTLPVGAENFYLHVREKIQTVKNELIKHSLNLLVDNIFRNLEQEKEIENYLKLFTANDENIERLQTTPGIGPMTAYMMIAVVDDVSRFKNSKEFASYLGLVPSITASANKRMMGSITRSGSEMLRRYLIHGARAWMRYAPDGSDKNRMWAEKVKERRGVNKAVVALAHRIARIAFAILRDKAVYRPTKAHPEEASAA